MKALLFGLLLLTPPAFAHTQAVFAQDGTKATFLLMSMTAADDDASNLYEAMAVPEENMNGKRTKRILFDNNEGQRALSLVCVMSQYVSTYGSCTLIVPASSNAVIDKGTTSAHVKFTDPREVARVSALFKVGAAGAIFTGGDGHLSIQSPLDFEVIYR